MTSCRRRTSAAACYAEVIRAAQSIIRDERIGAKPKDAILRDLDHHLS